MSAELTVSIVVPSFNQAPWVRDCLGSIIRQKKHGDQLIVVDAVSSDGTRDILDQYVDLIDQLIIEPDDGQADALVKGFSLASGDIVGYLNTDDMLLPGTLDSVRSYFDQHQKVDAIYGHRIFIDETGEPSGFWIIPFHSDYCMKRWDYIPQETCFWRRRTMEKVGGVDRDFQFAMDYDLFVRMMRVGRFRKVNRFLSCFRDHPYSKTNTQYSTVGEKEVNHVRSKYRIGFHWYDRIIGNLYGQAVLLGGKFFRLLVYPLYRNNILRRIASSRSD